MDKFIVTNLMTGKVECEVEAKTESGAKRKAHSAAGRHLDWSRFVISRDVILSDESMKTIAPAIHVVWGSIAGDCDLPTNEHAVETCIDADRIVTFAFKKSEGESAQRLIREAINAHGYVKVLRFLSNHRALQLI